MIEATVNDLLLIIGRQQVELEMLRRQVAGMQEQIRTMLAQTGNGRGQKEIEIVSVVK